MNSKNKNTVKIVCVYTGTVLGAGFASGKELINFFLDYGINGFIGMVIAGVLFSAVGFFVLEISRRKNIYDYTNFSEFIFGKRLGKIMEIFTVIFMQILFATMIAGGGSLISDSFSLSQFKSELVVGFVCFLIFLFDIGGLIKISIILCPILVIGGIFIGLYSFITSSVDVFLTYEKIYQYFDNFFNSAILYVSYNIITAVSVLVSLGKTSYKKAISLRAGILSGICMTLLGICMALPVFSKYDLIFLEEIPMLRIVSEYFIIHYIYIIILLCAVLTTAASNGFAVINAIISAIFPLKQISNKNSIIIKISVVLWGIILAQIGFSNFISTVYPLFGYIGIFQIIIITLKYFSLRY